MRDVLDEAAKRIEDASAVGGRFEDKPLVEASIRHTLGVTYRELGEYPAAEPHLERARELRHRVLGEEHPDTLSSMNSLAVFYNAQGRYDEAEPLSLRTLENRKRVLGDEHPSTLDSMNNLANLYKRQGRYDEAEPLYVETLEIRKRVLGKEHPSTLFSMMNLAWRYYEQEHFEQAQTIQDEAVTVSRRVWPAGSWFIGGFLGEYGATLIKLERYDDAEAVLLEAHETLTAARGPDFEQTISSTESLAQLYDAWGKPEQAAEWRAKLPTEQEAVAKD